MMRAWSIPVHAHEPSVSSKGVRVCLRGGGWRGRGGGGRGGGGGGGEGGRGETEIPLDQIRHQILSDEKTLEKAKRIIR